jgi:radical SAM superfamily enzyme YgiQ (UPF0313 family)
VKVLLVNTNREVSPWPVLPLGLSTVASALEAAGHAVRFLDLCFVPSPGRAVREEVLRFPPEAVGVTVRNIDNVSMLDSRFYLDAIRDEVIRPLRERSRAPVIIGGSAVGISPAAMMDHFGVDFAVAGEGEASMALWLDALRPGGPAFASIPGLHYRRPDGGVEPPGRLGLEPLAGLRHPRPYAWVDYRRYRRRGALAGIQTKRGCPFECLYCAYGLIEGCGSRLRDPEDVADEMEAWIAAARPAGFDFTDSVFNHPESHAVAVCEAVVRRGLRTRLTTMDLNPGPVSEELVGVMRAAGFRHLMSSPDSASPAMLERLKKNFTVDHLARAAERLRTGGLRVFWFFTLGGPGETPGTVRETLDFCARHLPPEDVVLFSIGFRISPGTALAAVAVEEGVIAPGDDLFRPAFYCSPATPPALILRMVHDAGRRHPGFLTPLDFGIYEGIHRALEAVVPFYKPRRDWLKLPELNRRLDGLGILPWLRRRHVRAVEGMLPPPAGAA